MLTIKGEGVTVVGCDAVLLDGAVVVGGGVAFVVGPAIERELAVELEHDVVAVGFGEDGGGGDGHEAGVAFDNALVGKGSFVVEAVAVDEEELWFEPSEMGAARDDAVGVVTQEGVGGEGHGVGGGVEYVEAVDLIGADYGDGPGGCRLFDFFSERGALTFGELLGVVEHWVGVAFGEEYGGSHNGSGQGAASGLVASRLAATRYEMGV
jgi:hypothetical protein